MLDGVIGRVVGGFEFAVGAMGGVGLMMEAAVGQWPAQALVKKEGEQSGLDAFSGQAVGRAGALALEQAVAFEFAQVIAELIKGVGLFG